MFLNQSIYNIRIIMLTFCCYMERSLSISILSVYISSFINKYFYKISISARTSCLLERSFIVNWICFLELFPANSRIIIRYYCLMQRCLLGPITSINISTFSNQNLQNAFIIIESCCFMEWSLFIQIQSIDLSAFLNQNL